MLMENIFPLFLKSTEAENRPRFLILVCSTYVFKGRMLTCDKIPIIGRPAESRGPESYGLQCGYTLSGTKRVRSLIGSSSIFLYTKDLSAIAIAVRYCTRGMTNQAACIAVIGAKGIGAYVTDCIAVGYSTAIITNQAA